jgi:hypothetical protein
MRISFGFKEKKGVDIFLTFDLKCDLHLVRIRNEPAVKPSTFSPNERIGNDLTCLSPVLALSKRGFFVFLYRCHFENPIRIYGLRGGRLRTIRS